MQPKKSIWAREAKTGNPIVSPLRYPGGKGRLFPRLDIGRCGWFVEPYAGGAGIGLNMLFSCRTSHLWLNDLDRRVFYFWKSVTERPNEFVRLVLETPVTIDEWHRQKEICNFSDDDLKVGFATFFLNRANFGGVLDSTPIGGRDQSGRHKIDSRYKKERLASQIAEIGKLAARIRVTNLAAADLLDEPMPDKSIVFLDPPYVSKRKLYAEEGDDFAEVSDRLAIARFPWFMTIDEGKIAGDFYSWAESGQFTLDYSFRSQGKKGIECLIWGNMDCPLVDCFPARKKTTRKKEFSRTAYQLRLC